jgi:hypothetical protein
MLESIDQNPSRHAPYQVSQTIHTRYHPEIIVLNGAFASHERRTGHDKSESVSEHAQECARGKSEKVQTGIRKLGKDTPDRQPRVQVSFQALNRNHQALDRNKPSLTNASRKNSLIREDEPSDSCASGSFYPLCFSVVENQPGVVK